MLVQVTHTPKWSLTFRTFIPPVLMLHSYVAPSALFVGISLVTEVAGVGPGPRVHSHVTVQLLLGVKGFVALVAGVRF